MTHSVYLLYDKNEELLYVGVTSRGWARQEEHARRKEWWHRVHRVELEHFPSRVRAEWREEELIRTRQPTFNVIYRIGASREEIRAALADHRPFLEARRDWIKVAYEKDRPSFPGSSFRTKVLRT